MILQHCERAAKRGWRNEFFFDSHIEYDPAACAFRQPQVLPQSKRVQEAVGTAQPTAAQMAAAESSSDEEEEVPLSRRTTMGRSPTRPKARPKASAAGKLAQATLTLALALALALTLTLTLP